MPQFDSGAAEPIGRFSEGLLLRLLHNDLNVIESVEAAAALKRTFDARFAGGGA